MTYKLPSNNPAKAPFKKTVYDSKIYPNMPDLAQTASHRILREFHANPKIPEHSVHVDGIKFDAVVRQVNDKATIVTIYPSGVLK